MSVLLQIYFTVYKNLQRKFTGGMSEDYKTLNLSLVLVAIFSAFLLSSGFLFKKDLKAPVKEEVKQEVVQYGFNLEKYHIEKYLIEPDQILSKFLYYQGIDFDKIIDLEKLSKDVFSIRNFRSGKELSLVHEDPCSPPLCMIYEPDQYTYVKYNFDNEIEQPIEKVEKETTKCIDIASGMITSNLWSSMYDLGIKFSILDKMEDALSSSVDFYHAKRNDKFKLIYEKVMIDGEEVGVGEVTGAVYQDKNGTHYAIYYENDHYQGFYDVEGRPTKGTFLRAPVKFSRISSRFNLRRFHPIKKRRIPHLGTDYAAPTGTPIMAVSNGVVEIAGYSKNNGKYVKIKHDGTYKTQYLHMNGFAKGIKKGARVSQGQTIGYVGQTGLATGPHVCFRFWKNGKQVNHLRENFPPQDPLPAEELPDFYEKRDDVMRQLDAIPFVETLEAT